MSTITNPVMLDETGQDIATSLQEIADAIVEGQREIIDDETTSTDSVWSSEKTSDEIDSNKVTVENVLNSTSITNALSANMGKSLNDTIAYFRNVTDNGRAKAFSGDVNTLHGQGNSIYWCDGNATSLPSGETYGIIATFICSGALWYGSQIFMSTSGNYYTREINGGIWGTWNKLVKEGTATVFTPTMPDGNTSIHRTCHYAVQGNHVHVDFAIKISNAQTGFSNRKICQTGIPSQYLPPVDIDVICSNGEATGYTLANLTADGKLIIYPQKSGLTYGIGWFEYFI